MGDRDLRYEVRKWKNAAMRHLTQKNDILNELDTAKKLNQELSTDCLKLKDQRDTSFLAIVICIVVFMLSVVILV